MAPRLRSRLQFKARVVHFMQALHWRVQTLLGRTNHLVKIALVRQKQWSQK